MKNMILILNLALLISCTNRDTIVDKDKLLGYDYRLFQQTPVWKLTKAVWDENTDEMKKIVQEEKVDVNYQEDKYGKTLLMLTIVNRQLKSCKSLIELGANPNIPDKFDGSSAMIEAAEVEEYSKDNTEFLKLLLAYDGNPNFVEVGKRREDNSTRNTPLIAACGDINEVVSPIYKVKLLVEAGADVNYMNEFKTTALTTAAIHDHYDVVFYLLENGADYQVPIFDREGKSIYLWDYLREVLFPLDSKKYNQKMQVVNFLKRKGIDYRKLPIPNSIENEIKKNYLNNSQEYFERY
jgi:uncharacterized protein